MNNEEFNDNLFFVFEKLLMDKELAEKFAKCKTEDELYNFCLKIKGGYTKEEWKKFAEIVYRLTIDKENDKILLDNDLEEIGGGNMANNIGKKALSGTLAALTAATALQIGSVNVSAASSSSKPRTSISQKSSSSKWRRVIKGVLIGAGVAAVAAALGYGVYRFVEYKKNDTTKNQPKPNVDQNFVKTGKEKHNLPNPGNTCYCNSVARLLYNDEKFRNNVMAYKGNDKKIEALKYVFSAIETGNVDRETLVEKYRTCFGYNGEQSDAADLLKNVKQEFPGIEIPEMCQMSASQFAAGNDDGEVNSVEFLLKHGDTTHVDLKKLGMSRSEIHKLFLYAKAGWLSQEEERKDSYKKQGKEDPLKDEKKVERKIRERNGMEAIIANLVINRERHNPENFESDGMNEIITKLKATEKKGIEYLKPLKTDLVNGRFLVRCTRADYLSDDENAQRFKDPFKVELDGKTYNLNDCLLHKGNDTEGHYVCLSRDKDGKWYEYDTSRTNVNCLSNEEAENMIRTYGVILGYGS